MSGWNAELDARSRAFVAHAEALAEWDRHILHSRHAVLSLEEEVLQVGTLINCLTRLVSLHAACLAHSLAAAPGGMVHDHCSIIKVMTEADQCVIG